MVIEVEREAGSATRSSPCTAMSRNASWRRQALRARKAAETAEAAAWKSDEQKAFRRKKNQIKRKVSKLRLAQR